MADKNGAIGSKQQIRYEDAKRVNLRLTNPGLYRGVMLFSILMVAQAMNFIFYKPTFNPYGIDKEVIGGIYMTIGVVLLILLNVLRNLKFVRVMQAFSAGFLLFWGISNMQQFFAGKSSLQLPIILIYVAFTIVKDLLEPPVNPMTRRDNNA